MTAATQTANGTVTIHAWDGGDGLMYLEAKDAAGSYIAYDTFREGIAAMNAVTTLRELYPDHVVKFGN